MSPLALLSLDLRSPFDYRGMENPPLRGAPFAGSLALGGGIPRGGGAVSDPAIGEGLAEGEEEIFLFEADRLVSFDPDEGPRVSTPLPPPGFYGRRKAGPATPGPSDEPGPPDGPGEPADGSPARGAEAYRLARGLYLFLQFRPRDEAGLAAGIEWFAREAWWEGNPGRGPYAIRRLREDGALATQILRLK